MAEASSSGGDQATWFAEHGGEPAGMINAYRAAGGTVTLTSLWAAPGHRHLGVADALMGRALEWAEEHGAARVRLWVVERNDEARDFYRRWGFRPTGREIKYEPDPRMIEIELERAVSSTVPETGEEGDRRHLLVGELIPVELGKGPATAARAADDLVLGHDEVQVDVVTDQGIAPSATVWSGCTVVATTRVLVDEPGRRGHGQLEVARSRHPCRAGSRRGRPRRSRSRPDRPVRGPRRRRSSRSWTRP